MKIIDFNNCNRLNNDIWDRKLYATRFYLPSSGAAGASPNYTTSWEDTSIAARLKCVTTKISSAMTTVSFTDDDETDKDILFRQYVSDPIATQTIQAQTIGFSIRAQRGTYGTSQVTSWRVYVVSNDGSSETGTIIVHRRDGTLLTTSLNSKYDSATSTEVIANANDRIVIEIGTGGDPSAARDHDSNISIGDDAVNDLDAADSDADADNPWVNFGTDTITFAGGSFSPSLSL